MSMHKSAAWRLPIALLVLVAVATATAVLVTLPGREKMPRLGTKSDGRYDFPRLALPPVPAPTVQDGGDLDAKQLHSADPRTLLLPAPKGARPAEGGPAAGSWVDTTAFGKAYLRPEQVTPLVNDIGVRNIAATSWRTADGVRTEIYLLWFEGPAGRKQFDQDIASGQVPAALQDEYDLYVLPEPLQRTTAVDQISGRVAKRPGADGRFARVAYIDNGDMAAVVVSSGPPGLPRVGFDQTVTLQAQLLRF
ncbi:hypothetical protein [Yinghuangia seranimata]|uniref:hypothetical protein n=1 Tax=Yinghuangia seranimata TaxID=408067 RepID=UPI00248CBFAC|nr:hypothetical protein [Yinghuangia seranimata]MDI2129356.1 hypothetical protein [Yinghuangia seranimata]